MNIEICLTLLCAGYLITLICLMYVSESIRWPEKTERLQSYEVDRIIKSALSDPLEGDDTDSQDWEKMSINLN